MIGGDHLGGFFRPDDGGACPARSVSEIMHELAPSFKLNGAIVAIVFRDRFTVSQKRGLPHGNQAVTEFGSHR